MDADDATEALTRIYYQDIRGAQTAPMAILRLGPGQVSTPALRAPRHVDAVNVELIWPELTSGTNTQNELVILQMNAFGKLLSEAHGLINAGTTYPVKADIAYEPPERVGDDDAFAGCWSATLTFSWEI
jgi:hypothetical protein